MRIVYVAKHGGHDNDDEGAIAHALNKLGHSVVAVDEGDRHKAFDGDFVLFHKWEDINAVRSLTIPYAFWYFDLVDSPDETLRRRCFYRQAWMRAVMPKAFVGFCTDGDWVARYPGRLVHLLQGCDERVAYPGKRIHGLPPILFAGMVNHGRKRAQHIAHLQERYGESFEVLGDGGPMRRIHGRELANYVAGRIVVAPDGPNTDRYWSNRVYQMLGFGAFLVHPFCEGLREQLLGGVHGLVFYSGWAECDRWIDYYLGREEEREAIAEAGHRMVLAQHTYLHRCEVLIEEVRRRL